MTFATDPGPYLSVVATSRNDDHGGSMLGRMQAFIEGLCGQCHRFNLTWELILVEWNPPSDRVSLAEALSWPKDKGLLSIRIVRVPPELHQALEHSDKLGLFQMVAKNVGARRARGEFLLFTNIDILINDALVQFLSLKTLVKGHLYRIDRNDVRNEVPLGAGVESILQWASANQIRRHRKDGSYRVKPNGEILWGSVIHPDFEVVFGFMNIFEKGREAVYMKSCARLALRKEMSHIHLVVGLAAEIAELGQLVLEVRSETGELLASRGVSGQPASGDLPRNGPIKDWQTLDIERHFEKGTIIRLEIRQGSLPPESMTWNCLRVGMISNQKENDHLHDGDYVVFGKGWHQWERDSEKVFFRWAGVGANLGIGGQSSVLKFQVSPGPSLEGKPARLLLIQSDRILNAFNLDCSRDLYLFSRGHSGEDGVSLFRLQVERPLPSFEGDPRKRVLGFQGSGFELKPSNPWITLVSMWNRCWFDWIRPRLKSLIRLKGGFKGNPGAGKSKAGGPDLASGPLEPLPARVPLREVNAPLGFAVGNSPSQDEADWWRVWHTNGCGDFTLLSREEFIQLGGYWEFHGFSMHIDSLFLYAAQNQGMAEVVLEEPMAIYHIEHQPGSGYTPEAADQMYERVRKKKLPYIGDDEVYVHRAGIFAGKGPANPPTWGFVDKDLPENVIE